jgi:phosphate transport system permease protein
MVKTTAERILVYRRDEDRNARRILFSLSMIPVGLVLVIIVALCLRFVPIMQQHTAWDLLSGTIWKPLKGQFGFLPFIVGTFWVTGVGVILAVPPCILTAVYLSEYAHERTRMMIKPLLDLLAAIPSVVYGVWGVIVIVPLVGDIIRPFMDRHLGFIPLFASNQPTGYSILSGGIVLAVMIAPFIISIAHEVLRTVPNDLRQASLALGATRWQTISRVVFPQTLQGMAAGVILGTSRALGETMAVLMVVGNVPRISTSIFDPAYPLPALIANNYGEMMSIPLYDAALMGVALVLLVIVLIFNISSTLVLKNLLGRKQS